MKTVTLGRCGVLAIALTSCTPSFAGETKKPATETQVTVLLKWYHRYAEDVKYEQAYQVAQLANELASESPETVVALKVARRQRNDASTDVKIKEELERILVRLERIEGRLEFVQAKKQMPPRRESPFLEPVGSPDRLP